jgi:hypothetical protein
VRVRALRSLVSIPARSWIGSSRGGSGCMNVGGRQSRGGAWVGGGPAYGAGGVTGLRGASMAAGDPPAGRAQTLEAPGAWGWSVSPDVSG